LVDYNDPLINGYFKRLIGENGITLLKTIPEGEHTDEEMYAMLNPIRKKASDLKVQTKLLKDELKAREKKKSSDDEETDETEIPEKTIEEIEEEIQRNEIEINELKEEAEEKEEEIGLNEIRKILFILSENNFTICKRERDTNSGWLTFRWQLNLVDIEHRLEREKRKLYRNLLRRQEYEKENLFYICPSHCVRLTFDESTEMEFMCPLCGDNLIYEENEIIKELLEKRIGEFQTANPSMFRKDERY